MITGTRKYFGLALMVIFVLFLGACVLDPGEQTPEWRKIGKQVGLSEANLEMLRKNGFLVSSETIMQPYQPYLDGRLPAYVTTYAMSSGFQALVNRTDVFLQTQAVGKLAELLKHLLNGIEKSKIAVKGDPIVVATAMNRARILLGVARKLLEPEWKHEIPEIESSIEGRVQAIRERRRSPISLGRSIDQVDDSTAMYSDLAAVDLSLLDDYRKVVRDVYAQWGKSEQYAVWNRAFTERTRRAQRYDEAIGWLRAATFQPKSDRDALCVAILAYALTKSGAAGRFDLQHLYRLADSARMLEEYSSDITVLEIGKALFLQHSRSRVVDAKSVKQSFVALVSSSEGNLLDDCQEVRSGISDSSGCGEIRFFARRASRFRLEVSPSSYEALFDKRILKSGRQTVWGLRVPWTLYQGQVAREIFEGHEGGMGRLPLDDWNHPSVDDSLSNGLRILVASLFSPLDPSTPVWMGSAKMLRVRAESAFATSSRFLMKSAERGFVSLAECADYGSDNGYIEPIPAFFSNLGVMAIKCRRRLRSLVSFAALSDDECVGLLRGYDVLSFMSFRLCAMSQKQLRGAPWNVDERSWFENFHSMYSFLFGMAQGLGDDAIVPVDDDYSVVRMPLGARSSRFACSGRARKIYVLYPCQGRRILCHGSVGSFYAVDSSSVLQGAQFKRLLDVLVSH